MGKGLGFGIGVGAMAVAVGAFVVLGGTPAPTPRLAVPSNSAARPASADVGGLQVSPLRVSVPDAGSESDTSFTVTNTSSTVREVSTARYERSANGTTLPDSIASAARWVRVAPASLLLAPGRTGTFVVHTTIPATREPGERRVAVVFGSGARAGSGVGFTVAIGASLFVPGPGLVDHAIALGALSAPAVVGPGPVALSIPVTNVGNVHRDLVTADSIPVGTVSGGGSITFDQGTVLPGQTGTLHATWHDAPTFCWCEIAVAVADGTGATAVVRAKVLVAPWKALGIVLSLVVVMLAGTALALRGRKRQSPGRLHARTATLR